MSLRKYYKILGLPENATPTEVRRQYRKLAMLYHPDKNPSIQAKEQFLIITDAYEILLGRKSAPVNLNTHVPRSKEKTSEDRVRDAKKRYYEQLEKEQLQNDLYFKSLFLGWRWKLIKSSSILGVVLAISLSLDLFLPRHYQKDRITHYAKNIYSSIDDEDVSLVKTKEQKKYWITGLDYSLFGPFPEVYIEKSWIYHQPINIVSIQKIDYGIYPVSYTFYGFTPIMILIFLLPFITIMYKQQTILFTIMYNMSVYVTPLLILIFLLTNDHWAHLLTFGFL